MYAITMVTMKSKVTFAVLNISIYWSFQTLLRIFKIKTPNENHKHVPYNNKKQIVR